MIRVFIIRMLIGAFINRTIPDFVGLLETLVGELYFACKSVDQAT